MAVAAEDWPVFQTRETGCAVIEGKGALSPMKWKLMIRTLLYGSSLTAFAVAVHQVVLPHIAHAEPACCNYEESENSCGINATCKFTNEECNEGTTSNAQGYTCVDD